MNTPQKIIVHHTASLSSGRDQWNGVNEDHRVRFNFISSLGFYIGYQYFIEPSGKLKQARLDTDEGAHTIGQNKSSIGVCLAGDFDRQMPTQAQIDTLTNFLFQKTKQYAIPINAIYPHRKFAQKSCYGYNLSDVWAANLLRGYIMGKIAQIKNLIQALLLKVASNK